MVNYQSTALSTFVPACTKRGVRLLLPEPTDQEIERHIKERSTDALVALAEARRKGPFLAKWPGMPPPTGKSEALERFQVYAIARKEWRAFLKQFTLVTLGYPVRAAVSMHDGERFHRRWIHTSSSCGRVQSTG